MDGDLDEVRDQELPADAQDEEADRGEPALLDELVRRDHHGGPDDECGATERRDVPEEVRGEHRRVIGSPLRERRVPLREPAVGVDHLEQQADRDRTADDERERRR